MSTHPTAVNAEAVANAIDRALKHLTVAQTELRDALLLARDDYPHNADKLEQIVGALGLLTSATSVDYYQWDGYARARRIAAL